MGLYDRAVTDVQLNLLGSHDSPRFRTMARAGPGLVPPRRPAPGDAPGRPVHLLRRRGGPRGRQRSRQPPRVPVGRGALGPGRARVDPDVVRGAGMRSRRSGEGASAWPGHAEDALAFVRGAGGARRGPRRGERRRVGRGPAGLRPRWPERRSWNALPPGAGPATAVADDGRVAVPVGPRTGRILRSARLNPGVAARPAPRILGRRWQTFRSSSRTLADSSPGGRRRRGQDRARARCARSPGRSARGRPRPARHPAAGRLRAGGARAAVVTPPPTEPLRSTCPTHRSTRW